MLFDAERTVPKQSFLPLFEKDPEAFKKTG